MPTCNHRGVSNGNENTDLARKEIDMDCKDLMVGDWIEDGYKKAQVTSITCDGIVETTAAISNIEVVDPIPLTEEILVKNGFVKTWNGDWQLKEYSTIIISKDYYVEIFERIIRIDYLHELQHMLHAACVDKELVID